MSEAHTSPPEFVCEKCDRNREGLPEIPIETVDGKGRGWKCDECGWWTWTERFDA